MSEITKAPELRDEVKNKNSDMVGIVIAKYPLGNPSFTVIDVRGVNEKIYYASPIENWTVIRLNDE